MAGPHECRGARLVLVVLVMVVLSTMLAPSATASLDVEPGDTAQIVGAGGDPINLRAKPNTSGDVVASFWEGRSAEVLEGPIWDDAGIAWYKVVIDGIRGYMAAEFLDVPGGTSGGGGGLDPITGSATIVNTGGDPIRCRTGPGTDYSIVTSFNAGDAVALTGLASGSWLPVRCGDAGGYVHVDYVGSGDDGEGGDADQGSEAEETVEVEETVSVTNTGGDPINLRAKPNTSAAILDAVGEGTPAGILEGPIVDETGMSWYKVVIQGTRGYMAAEFLGLAGGSDSPDSSSSAGTDGLVTWSGTISGTNGDGVRCRTWTSTEAATITVLAEGTVVDVIGDPIAGWYAVQCAGAWGSVSADYVSVAEDAASVAGGDGRFSVGTTLTVSGTNGEGVRLRSRSSAESSTVTVLPEGQDVVVRGGSTDEWVAVRHPAGDGFVHAEYLAVAGASPTPSTEGELGEGDRALVTEALNFRSRASLDASVLSVAPADTVVEVVGDAGNGFYRVNWSGRIGYLQAEFLASTDRDLTIGQGGVGGAGQPGDGPADQGDSTPVGREMVRYAQRYLGYPYVWATSGPTTFDCSGFTYWVTLKVAGIDVGAGTWLQSVAGRPVPYGDLQPGDFVFFQNTYTWGLSHVGLYMGDGKFIHASGGGSVMISDLEEPYFKSRWFGARRML